MVVQHNISAMNANRLFGINNSGLSKSLEKLSSGFAINRAGDNAAGLAVSEKMRAQISGLTQASKNAEDGISMVQTFEGALQETDSILQRMRTLAVQSANGSYQNDVDREAIQLEYDQLNDELNQIADTDFNGVVVLNGGEMADGLKAVDGEFNYATASRQPKQLAKSDINMVDSQAFDDSDTTAGRTKADTVWNDLSDGKWDRSSSANDHGPESIDVTFQYSKADGSWKAISATNGADYNKITTVTDTDNGGFSISTDNATNFANVVVDESKLQEGDTITLTLKNPDAGIAAPTNSGAEVIDKTGFTEGTIKAADANLEVAVDPIDDADYTDTMDKIMNALNGATVTAKYTEKTATVKADLGFTFSDGTTITAGGKGKSTLADGTEFYYDADTTAGQLKIGTVKADGSGIDQNLITIDMKKAVDTDTSKGTISYKIGIEYNNYDSSKTPSISVKAPEGGNVSKSNAFNKSTSTLTYTDHITLQTGARTKDAVDFTFAYESKGLGELEADLDCSARGLGTDKLSLATQEDANNAIDKIDNAINKVSMVRATFGAMQNRLEHKIANLDTNNENLTAAESRIRDTDMAKEMTNFTKNQILSQASQAMLAQANQLPQGVLQLLG